MVAHYAILVTRQFHISLSSQAKSKRRAACSLETIVGVSHTLLVLALAALLVVSVSATATCRLTIKA